jgi:hypothetical protein
MGTFFAAYADAQLLVMVRVGCLQPMLMLNCL